MSADRDYRKYFEDLLTEVHANKFNLTEDRMDGEDRIVTFEKYQIICTLIRKPQGIDFDIYTKIKAGIYELGELHLITRKMLELKKIALKYNAREMNTTERLYPQDRQGKETKTSGL